MLPWGPALRRPRHSPTDPCGIKQVHRAASTPPSVSRDEKEDLGVVLRLGSSSSMSVLARRMQGLFVARSRVARNAARPIYSAVRGVATTTVETPVATDAVVPPTTPRVSEPARARQLLRWLWLSPSKRQELEEYVTDPAQAAMPSWFASAYDEARQYRTARSRRWLPSSERVGGDVSAFLERECEKMRSSLEQEQGIVSLAMWDAMDADEQADVVLQPMWASMTPDEREQALVRVTYECARRLGWRSGFSSGYPGAAVPKALREQGTRKTAARRALQQQEETRAWDAWQAMTPEERRVEFDTAWRLRDRSVVYIDDAPTTRLLGATAPRWYAQPQRAGTLTFLPNVSVRLVRNHTPRGQAYDVWKATFRVPLSMHKHMLRSYLLAVYGLRTTWARSMVYRSRTVFSAKKMRRVVGRDRTFKKIEVGLLEPFVFPGLTKDFLRSHLFSQEMMYEEHRLLLKMTKGRRWRSHKTVRDLSRAMDRNWEAQSAGAPDEASSGKPSAQLMVRKRSVPTARHNNILSAIAERRAERAARVQKFLDEKRSSSSSSS